MKHLSLLLTFSLLATHAQAQSSAIFPADSPVALWPDGAVPEARGVDPATDVPTLTPYLPDPEKASGAAVVICPGGGYGALAEHEGKGYAL